MSHLEDSELSALLDGALDDKARERAERHLAECAPCRESLAERTANDQALAVALAHDPGDAYFETFASRVQERLRTKRAAGLAPMRPGFLAWFSSPRHLAWAGGVAALVVGAGLVFLTARESPLTELRNPTVARRAAQSASPPPAAPSAPQDQLAPPPTLESRNEAEVAPQNQTELAPATPLASTPPAAKDAAPPPASMSKIAKSSPSATGTANKPKASGTRAPSANAGSTSGRRDAQGKEEPSAAKQSFASPPSTAPAERQKETAKAAPAPISSAEEIQVVAPRPDGPLGRLCGKVRDRNGRPVSGAQVVIADRGTGVVTDAEGRYCVDTPAGSYTLSVLALGYEPVRRTVTVGEKSESDVTLHAVSVLETPMALRGGTAAMLASDEYASWPADARSPARRARALADSAARRHSASAYDDAGAMWERALKATRGGDPELAARGALADARYHAWELSPTSKRAGQAVEALTAFLTRAPAGPARDLAARRLDQLRR